MSDEFLDWVFTASGVVFILGCFFGPVVVVCLWERRLADAGGADPYPADDPPAEHAALLRRRVAVLVAAGNAGYLDDEQTAWRYSVKGAVLMSARMMPLALRRMVWKD